MEEECPRRVRSSAFLDAARQDHKTMLSTTSKTSLTLILVAMVLASPSSLCGTQAAVIPRFERCAETPIGGGTHSVNHTGNSYCGMGH